MKWRYGGVRHSALAGKCQYIAFRVLALLSFSTHHVARRVQYYYFWVLPALLFVSLGTRAVVLLRQRCVKRHKILVRHRKQNIPDVFPYRACVSDPKIVGMLASMSKSFAIILFRSTTVVYLFFKIVFEYLFSL